MRELPHHFHPSAHDSAGQPWAGRQFEENPYADDDGTAPAELTTALEAFAAEPGAPELVVEALREARVLIPLVAALGEAGENAEGVTVDKSAELSIVSVAGPDGRRVLPVFSSAAAMRAWNPEARPVPVAARTAALAAVDDATELLVLDPAGPIAFGLRRPAVWALAQGETWTLQSAGATVAQRLGAAVQSEAAIAGVEVGLGVAPGSLDGPEWRVVLGLTVDADDAAAREAVARVRATVAGDAELLAAADSLVLDVRRTDGHTADVPPDSGDTTVTDQAHGRRPWWRRRRGGERA